MCFKASKPANLKREQLLMCPDRLDDPRQISAKAYAIKQKAKEKRILRLMETINTTATYSKLSDGSWGIRATGDVSPGLKIKVQKKNGEINTHIIGRIIEQRDEFYYCTIATARDIKDAAKAKSRQINSLPGITTYPKISIPPDSNVIPFDPPYVKK